MGAVIDSVYLDSDGTYTVEFSRHYYDMDETGETLDTLLGYTSVEAAQDTRYSKIDDCVAHIGVTEENQFYLISGSGGEYIGAETHLDDSVGSWTVDRWDQRDEAGVLFIIYREDGEHYILFSATYGQGPRLELLFATEEYRDWPKLIMERPTEASASFCSSRGGNGTFFLTVEDDTAKITLVFD